MNPFAPAIRRSPQPPARARGVAMVLVMIALVVGTVITLSFLASQTTSTAIAHNAVRQVQARAVAEDGMRLVVEHLRGDQDWRDGHTHGLWTASTDLNGGSFRVMFEDEDDSDLGDDVSEPFVVTVEATYNGIVHRTRNRIVPTGTSSTITVMLVTGTAFHADEDLERIAVIESWGYRVLTVTDSDAASVYDAAAAQADVVYVSEESASGSVGTKLNGYGIGVVNEEQALQDELRMSTSGGNWTGSTIDITDNTHPITAGFALGDLQITHNNTGLIQSGGTPAAGLNVLAERVSSSTRVLTYLDIGDTMTNGDPSPQRRVTLPFGSNAFEYGQLNDDGQQLMKQAIDWAAQAESNTLAPDYQWGLDETSGVTAQDSRGGQDGTYTLGPTLGTLGVSGTAATFTDSNFDRVTLPAEVLNGKTDFTISLWLKTAKTGQQGVFSGARSSNNNAQLMFFNNSTQLRYYYGNSTGSYKQWTVSSVADDQWHHVVLARDQTNSQVTLYLNGVSQGSQSQTLSAADLDHLILAEEQDSVDGGYSSSQAFVGSLDDFRIYDSVLTADDVNALYEQFTDASDSAPELVALYEFEEPTPVTPQLVGHWKLDEDLLTAGIDVLFVVPDASSLGSQDSAKRDLIESWGWDVTLLSDESSQSAYDAAAAAADVVYISEEVSEPQVDTKLRYSSTGVVLEEHDLGWEFRLSSSYAVYTGTQIDIVDNTHYITSPFSTGNLSITSSSISLPERNSDASGMQTLAEAVGWYTTALGTVEVGHTLRDATGAEGRRVILPWGYSNFDVNLLNTNGENLLHRSLEWAASNRVVDEVQANHGKYVNDMNAGLTGHGDGGTAAEFDGSSHFAEVPHTSSYLLDEGALSFWVYADDLSGTQGLIAKDASGFGTGGHLRVYTSGSSLAAQIQSDSASFTVSSSGGLSASTWHHVVVGFGGSGFRLYLDGVLVDSDEYAGGLGTSSGGTGNQEPWTFGVDQSASNALSSDNWNNPFHGRIDDVRLYDRNLNADQAGDLMAMTDPRAAAPPTVADTAGTGTPLDLTIADPDHVTWISGGGLTIDAATQIASTGGVTRFYDAVTESDAFTVEVAFTPSKTNQSVPERLITYSDGTANRNFELVQDQQKYGVKVRTEFNTSGTPEAASGDVLADDVREQLIFTYDNTNEELRVYRNGTLEVTETWTGDLDNWNSGYELMLVNVEGGSRPWLGTLHRVAIYDGAFNSIQADNVFNGDAPGDGAGGDEGLAYQVEWLESP